MTAEGYTTPTPIQAQAIPHVIAGRDVLGCAQTGTGKTAAFALPIIHRLQRDGRPQRRVVRALILTPTRELAVQIADSCRTYGRYAGLRGTTLFGGVSQHPQVHALRQGVDILVATPGRLLDLMGQGHVDLTHVEIFVLDEADRMFDMGFIHDVRRVVAALPAERQTLLFSATMADDVRKLADAMLVNPVAIQVTPVSSTAERIEQTVFFVDKPDKSTLLLDILAKEAATRVLVFTRTKHGADRLVRQLDRAGVRAEAIHGDKGQNARQRALDNFRRRTTPVLVATDVAARGLDIDEVSHVVNYDMPVEPETYVHRIGRTARAGASGVALSFCDNEERTHLFAIEKLIRQRIPIMRDGERIIPEPYQPPAAPSRRRPPVARPRNNNRRAPFGQHPKTGAARRSPGE